MFLYFFLDTFLKRRSLARREGVRIVRLCFLHSSPAKSVELHLGHVSAVLHR